MLQYPSTAAVPTSFQLPTTTPSPGRRQTRMSGASPRPVPTHVTPTPSPRAVPGLRGHLPLPSPFPLEMGGMLEGAVLAWEICGNPRGPLVAVLGGIGSDGHVTEHAGDPRTGWWPGVVGASRVLDPSRYRLLGIDFLAGPGQSTGPAQSGGHRFPDLTPGDQAAALSALLDHLGVPQLRAIVGGSYGGMVALAFAARCPERVAGLVVLGAAHVPDPHAAAVRSIQRAIVRLGLQRGAPDEGLALARALALTTYRAPEEFRARFPGAAEVTEDGVRVASDDYLEHHGWSFLQRLDPARYLIISASIDLHRVDPGLIRVPVTLAGFREDALVPPCTLRDLVARLPEGSSLTELSSPYGHDGFLKEVESVSRVIRHGLALAGREDAR